MLHCFCKIDYMLCLVLTVSHGCFSIALMMGSILIDKSGYGVFNCLNVFYCSHDNLEHKIIINTDIL